MRFRLIFFFIWPFLFLWIPATSAQKRVFATVNPNATITNRNATVYDPLTGSLMAAAGEMQIARLQHSAVPLGRGKALIVGGYNGRFLKDAEIYDSSSGTFTATGSMLVTRTGAVGVALRDGTALVAGGYNGGYINLAEVYDPVSGVFTAASNSMSVPRQNASAVRLNDGTVLIMGGFDGTSGSAAFQSSSDLYSPATRSFSFSSSMADARVGHTSTLLPDGRVLVTGGCNNTLAGKIVCDRFLASAEIYSSISKLFSPVGTMTTSRMNHTATLLPNGQVLIAGGSDGTSPLASAELYNPATDTFTRTGDMQTARTGHTASILPNGKVLIAGGYSGQYLASAEIYDPETGEFTALSSEMAAPRFGHTATVLSNGQVLLAGGQNSGFLTFDVNFQSGSDNIAPNIVFSPDSQLGFVPYTGSGVVVAFSTETGAVTGEIVTGGKPSFITPLPDGRRLAVVSALDNRIFIIDTSSLTLQSTYSFDGMFGFGSILSLSPDGTIGYVSSTSTGEVIKFDISSGTELGRLTNLQAPAQITLTKDGNTLLVVDTKANEVVFVDSSSMTATRRVAPVPDHPSASFTIFNKAVLNSDDTRGVIASQDLDALITGTAFVFDTSTGKILASPLVGFAPGVTALSSTGSEWLVLCQNSLSVVPIADPDSVVNSATVQGSFLGLANLVVTEDSKYAYYTSSVADRIYQHDIDAGSVVGSFLVGDDPDVSADQASSLAVTPDGQKMVVLNFTSNQLDILVDTTVVRQTRFLSQLDKFTGLSLVNLSDVPADLKITALSDTGALYFPSTDIVNPVTLRLEPNAQLAVDTAQLFNLDTDINNSGRLVIESSQPSVVGYSMIGQVRGNLLNPYLGNLEGVPLYTDYRQSLHNFIIPEIPQASGAETELDFVNPNYNASNYDVAHYGTEGSFLETNADNRLEGSVRNMRLPSEFITTAAVGQVMIYGGFASTSTWNIPELFDASTRLFLLGAAGSKTPRHGHSATFLPNGKILLAGGKNQFTPLKSADLFDPVASTFSSTPGTMISERYRHTATLLQSGEVLLAGGQNSVSLNRTAELYDPLSGSFRSTAVAMTSPRDAHTATLLPDGKVLLAGGLDGTAITATAELYDPATSRFIPTGSMNVARAFHTAVLLPTGKVLVAGGYNGSYLNSAEIYDPSTGEFRLAPPMAVERSKHTCTVLSDGTALIVGGANSSGPLDTAELYDPDEGRFVTIEGSLLTARSSHTATLLEDDTGGTNDRVLIAGGFGIVDNTTGALGTLAAAELYTPGTRQFSATSGDMTLSRQEHSATLLPTSAQGYLRGTSDRGVLFTEFYSNGGASTSLNGIDVDKYAGVTRIYSPLFVLFPNFDTVLNVINGNQDSEAVVTITLHAPDGSVLTDPVTRVFPKNAQLKGSLLDIFKHDPILQSQRGWLEIASSVDRVVGSLSFTNVANSFLASFELSGSPMSRFVLPLVSQDSDFMTGIAMLNVGSQPAHVQLELWGVGGTLDNSRTITIAPGAHLSQLVSELFPDMEPHRSANVRVHSDQPLHVMGTMFDRGLRFVASVPPVPVPEP